MSQTSACSISASVEVDYTELLSVVSDGDLYNASFSLMILAWSNLPTYILDLCIVMCIRLVPC